MSGSLNGQRRTAIRSYLITKFGMALFFAVYVTVAVLGGLRGGEFFPVFNWSLFTEVRSPRWVWELEVVRIGEQRFDPPAQFYSLGDYFAAAASRDTSPKKLLRRWDAALRTDPVKARTLQEVLETGYLSVGAAVEYRLMLRQVDPLERRRSGAVIEEHVLGQWTYDGRP